MTYAWADGRPTGQDEGRVASGLPNGRQQPFQGGRPRHRGVVERSSWHGGTVQEVALEITEAPVVHDRVDNLVYMLEDVGIRHVQGLHPQSWGSEAALQRLAFHVTQEPVRMVRRKCRVRDQRRRREPDAGSHAGSFDSVSQRLQAFGEAVGVGSEPIAPRRLPPIVQLEQLQWQLSAFLALREHAQGFHNECLVHLRAMAIPRAPPHGLRPAGSDFAVRGQRCQILPRGTSTQAAAFVVGVREWQDEGPI
mmetsp:Transcript_74698/g.210630  ORF Transcript_74698/g.210630 Transcript_74698/m.210630 type:complete len:251 (+) Transcript_74698:1050-1802(+)